MFALIGTAAGVATGLLPGLHVNTVAAFVLSLQVNLLVFAAGLFSWAGPTPGDLAVIVAALIVGNVVAHTFLDYIPSIFLGAPEAETALSVLPGHRMLLQGRGLEAVRISAVGSGAATLLSALLVVPLALVMGAPVNAYEDLRPLLPFLLLLVAAILIVAEPARSSRARVDLACELPGGLLRDGEDSPKVPRLTPTQASGHPGAYLLRGSVSRWGRDFVEIEDGETSLKVALRGEVETPLEGEVSLFVAPEDVVPRFGALVQRGWALLVFTLAGFLGYAALMTPLFEDNLFPFVELQGDARTVAFLPLFTGLFGIPTLLISLRSTPKIPAQELKPSLRRLSAVAKTRAILSGSLAGAVVAWLPGITGATATVLSRFFSGRQGSKDGGDEEFILSLSCVNTATALFTIVALFVLLRARSGGMVAVQSIAGPIVAPWVATNPMPLVLILLLVAAGVAAAISFLLTPLLGALFARVANRVPYSRIVITILVLLVTMVILFSGLTGLVVAISATLLGLLCPLVGVRRVHLMGSLLLPLILVLG